MTLVDDRTFIRHFSWVLGGIVGITIFFIFLAFLIVGLTGVEKHSGYTYTAAEQTQMKQEQAQAAASAAAAKSAAAAATAKQVASNASAGKAASGGAGGGAAAAAAAASAKKETAANAAPDGHKIWQAHCAMCHQTGLAGAPKIGDKKEWAPILAGADMKTIFHRDINGYTGKRGTMPPKGGNPGLSDADVIAAAKYMIGKSGGNPGS